MKKSLPILVVATRNTHKTREIAEMLEGVFDVKDLSAYPEAPFVDETGTTFLENASLKAISGSKVIAGMILADDSGLEVDALGGKPGVYSSSFGGEEGNHEKNNFKMMEELARVKAQDSKDPLHARFNCCMVLALNGEILAHFEGVVEGTMLLKLTGEGGFGYDPLFRPRGFTQSFAELGSNEKNTLSHRGRALVKVVAYLRARAHFQE